MIGEGGDGWPGEHRSTMSTLTLRDLVARREFLLGMAATVGTVACSSDSEPASNAADADAEATSSSSTTATTTPPAVKPVEPPTIELAGDPFTLGVSSGDPTHESVILWTRLAVDPVAEDGGIIGDNLELAYDIGADDSFTELVASGLTVASAAVGFSVHLDATGLEPATTYHYRFRVGGYTSSTGRTRTFPAPGETPDRFTFVMASCMDRQWGRYGAWQRASEVPDLDAVLFLGDFIYELNIGDASPEQDGSREWTVPQPTDLGTYRTRYGLTLTDNSLQSARQAAPWIVTWDDHEVVNNYAGDTDPYTPGEEVVNRARRAAAYQAWWENQPVRLEVPEDWADFPIHRELAIGDLATMFVIETRQYADEPPCRIAGEVTATDTGPSCDEALGETRTNLGAEQEAWLHDALERSTRTWNLIANPLLLSSIDIGLDGAPPTFERDNWDGYPGPRRRLVERLKTDDITNPVILTGDWHASFALDLRDDDGLTVAPEFLVTSISTVFFDDDYRARNPHIRYFGAGNGFATCTITPEHFTTEFSFIKDVWDADSPIATTATWRVLNGEHTATEVA